jgi:RNA polymerase sigma-70 factor (ECF subfamily)
MTTQPSHSRPEDSGDRLAAFEAQVREQQAGLRAYIRALGVEDAWVSDLAQETFVVAYRRWDEFHAGQGVGKWLRGIARNLVANERRKGARRARLLPLAMADVLAGAEETDEASARADLLLQAMRECVHQLPERSRAILHGRYARGLSSPTLAVEWATTAESMRQTLVRIRVAVKACVERRLAGEFR